MNVISSSTPAIQPADRIPKGLAAAQGLLTSVFGHASFRKGQAEAIEHILQGGHTLAIFPTGAGKSLCYQIPALLMPGLTLVISPLISLMKDQVDALTARGIPAAYISSALSDHEVERRIQDMRGQRLKIVYIAPERFYSEAFMNALKQVPVSFIAVDEAHCISQWGQNFRPAYLKIKDLIKLTDNPVTAAFTATANRKVQGDIVRLLDLDRCRLLISSFDRPNLELHVTAPSDGKAFVLSHIRKHPGEAGIIYAGTRRNVGDLYHYIKNHQYQAGMYHAGLGSEQRSTAQDRFIQHQVPVMVATNAFGMGINKKDVRYIIHYNMPKSLENYYQEAGRAGRDGKPSRCILLKTTGDYKLNRFLIECNYPPVQAMAGMYKRILRRKAQGLPMELLISKNASDAAYSESALKKLTEYNYVDIRGGMAYARSDQPFTLTQEEINRHRGIELDKLDDMQRYLEEPHCLRAYILRYFNEQPEKDRCGHCSACLRGGSEAGAGALSKLFADLFG